MPTTYASSTKAKGTRSKSSLSPWRWPCHDAERSVTRKGAAGCHEPTRRQIQRLRQHFVESIEVGEQGDHLVPEAHLVPTGVARIMSLRKPGGPTFVLDGDRRPRPGCRSWPWQASRHLGYRVGSAASTRCPRPLPMSCAVFDCPTSGLHCACQPSDAKRRVATNACVVQHLATPMSKTP